MNENGPNVYSSQDGIKTGTAHQVNDSWGEDDNNKAQSADKDLEENLANKLNQ